MSTRTAVASTDDRSWMVVDDVVVAAGVRRAAVALGTEIGLPPAKVADVAIVAMETATNLARHADDGMLLLRVRRLDDRVGIELVAIDHGPGMADIAESARDGHSTGGTLGIGMGAIARLADDLDIYSRAGSGTVLALTLWDTPPVPVSWADGISRPIDGEEVCGDGYAARDIDGRRQIMLCDGLGHGPLAALAAAAVVTEFRTAPPAGPKAVLEHIHARTRHTRGVVAAVAELDRDDETIRFAGIGNIAAVVHRAVDATDGRREPRRGLVSLPGIVGQQRPDIREFDAPFPEGSLVVLHSDGLSSRWTFDDHPGLTTHSPLVIAAVLLRSVARRRDDASVLVARLP
jgi:anti-sigma regulatory factor (Ser/Thr protein kinase)